MNEDDLYLLAVQEDLVNSKLEIEKLKKIIKEQADKIHDLESSLINEIKTNSPKRSSSPIKHTIKKIKTFFVRQRQRALAIKFDEDVGDVPVHEIAGEAADAERGGTVRTRRAAHDGADHVVEDTDGVHRWVQDTA